MKISIITPTVREKGLMLVRKALKQQTLTDWEWIVISPKSPKTFLGIHWLKDPMKEIGDVWTLNKAYNKALKEAKGELIVSWQDYTFAKPDALEKFWFHYEKEPKTCVTGVGNKYTDDSWTVQTWRDPREREDQGTYYPCYYNDIEGNFSAVPRSAFFSVGGFDETLDKYFGMDYFSVMDRLNIQGGWDFKIDQTNKSFSLEHGRLTKDWDEKNALGSVYNTHRLRYLKSPNLGYL